MTINVSQMLETVSRRRIWLAMDRVLERKGMDCTAPGRLKHLLPWIEGEPLSRQEVDAKIFGFLGSTFAVWAKDPSAELADTVPEPEVLTDRQLEVLRRKLRSLLEEANEPSEDYAPALEPEPSLEPKTMHSLRSLRFGVVREEARPNKLPKNARERKRILGPGAFKLVLSGKLGDLMVYALMRTLTEPGAVTLGRCPAPAPNDWSRRCGRFVISGKRRGRPAQYCSDACRIRSFREKDARRK